MTDLPEIEEGVQKAIVDAVDAFWKENERPLLLSSLGTRIKREFGDTSEIFPKGLKEFLREWPLVQFVEHPNVKEKIGLVPNGIALPDDRASLFPLSGKQRIEEHSNSYVQIFWDAFFRPIQTRRFVVVESDGSFNIINGDPPSVGKIYEILPTDLVANADALTVPEKVKHTHESILTWLLKNDLRAASFTKSRMGSASATVGKLDLIKQAFSGLSQQDQSRIAIPLDIVLKLIS